MVNSILRGWGWFQWKMYTLWQGVPQKVQSAVPPAHALRYETICLPRKGMYYVTRYYISMEDGQT